MHWMTKTMKTFLTPNHLLTAALTAALFLTGAQSTEAKAAAKKAPKPAPAAPAPAPAPQVAAPGPKPTTPPQAFVQSLYARLNVLAKSASTLDALHGKIGDELKVVVDYPEMAKLALGQKWAEISEAQRKEFVTHLTGMVLNTYVKRFKPGQSIEIHYGQAPRALPDDRVQIPTTITVGKSSAEVHYSLRPNAGTWWVYDIVVDEASQVQTYRQSFKKILDKEGWPGLMTRMKKAAEKKV